MQVNSEPIASQRKRRGFRYQRVAGLFEEFVPLTPLSSWLPRLQAEDPDRFQEVSQILNDLLPTDSRFLGEMENDEFLFTHCGVPVPLGALSDGYRAYIGWVSDLLYNISIGASKGTHLRDARGVVLIDEIDLHLHPEWQREVVPTVARALPNLQFVLTTHSPIVAGTLSTKNIFVLEMDHAGASTIHQLSERRLAAPSFGGAVEYDVDHHRPKNGVQEWPTLEIRRERDITYRFSTGGPFPEGYYLLAYHVLNYAIACKKCNSPLKANFFPVAGQRGEQSDDPAALREEKPFLLYPLGDLDEDPEAILTFDGINPVPRVKRGPRRWRAQVTIQSALEYLESQSP